MRNLWILAALGVSAFFTGCGADRHARATQAALDGDRLTLGSVQKDIRKGMNATEVLEAMGSPNIVTSGENGTETWVYDKIATDTVHSKSNGWWFMLVAGGSSGSGASSSSQRTLTVIIKFDREKLVSDLAYHSSRF